MKLYKKIVMGMSLFVVSSLLMGGQDSCIIRLTAQQVQEILDAINIIKPKITSIEITINEINEGVATCCALLSSKIDNIMVNVSGIDIIERELESCCALLGSKIDNIMVNVSGIDVVLTCCDTINSKIGNLNGNGTCLDSLIDVPEDINNLNLTVIQLLKTILLELRGCSPC